MKKFKSVFTSAVVSLAMASCAMAPAPALADCYSDGVRVGSVQKLSKKGLVNKSWEGEMVMEGIQLKQGKGGDIWKFSVTDASVAEKINESMMTGSQVALKYCQSAINSGLTTDTSYIITQAAVRGK